jgi:hypothetical protein
VVRRRCSTSRREVACAAKRQTVFARRPLVEPHGALGRGEHHHYFVGLAVIVCRLSTSAANRHADANGNCHGDPDYSTYFNEDVIAYCHLNADIDRYADIVADANADADSYLNPDIHGDVHTDSNRNIHSNASADGVEPNRKAASQRTNDGGDTHPSNTQTDASDTHGVRSYGSRVIVLAEKLALKLGDAALDTTAASLFIITEIEFIRPKLR